MDDEEEVYEFHCDECNATPVLLLYLYCSKFSLRMGYEMSQVPSLDGNYYHNTAARLPSVRIVSTSTRLIFQQPHPHRASTVPKCWLFICYPQVVLDATHRPSILEVFPSRKPYLGF